MGDWYGESVLWWGKLEKESKLAKKLAQKLVKNK